jgi:DNA-binding beta-propeller fold protein YncE
MLTPEQNAFFIGPSLPQQQISACVSFMYRQQVGNFLYVCDRQRGEITVLNSNRMTIVDRIPLPDPTSLAMSTDLEFLAVSNQLADVVSFIDIDPASSTFHQLIKTVAVGNSPRGIAWDPGNEDILVCNEGDDTMSIISCHQLLVRKTVKSNLSHPFEVTITPRQFGFGFQRGVYFAYILNRNGDVALFESGPNTVNGWGYDDVIGTSGFEFRNPKTIQADLINLNSSVWIVHEGPIDIQTGDPGELGVGAVSNLAVVSAIVGQLPLNFTSLTIPQYRDMHLEVKTSIGIEDLSGVPVDIAFDDQRNLGGEPNVHNIFSAGAPAPQNGKNVIRPIIGGYRNACTPQYAFIAVPNSAAAGGLIDVLDIGATGGRRIDTNPFQAGTQSIPASNATVLAHYYRQ